MATRRSVLFGLPALGLLPACSSDEPRPLMRLGVITDIHHSTADVGTKLCTKGIGLTHEAIGWFNDASVDAIVDLGDKIEEVDAGTDPSLASQVYSVFHTANAPHAHVPGNHDIRNMDIAAWETIFGSGEFTSRRFDVGGFRVVMFCPIRTTGPFTLTPTELDWLEDTVSEASIPCIVCTHVPIRAGSFSGNGYFADGGNGEWTNGADAAAILKASPTIMVLQGHTHWNHWHVEDDIHYLTIPSLTEARRTPPYPSASAAIIDFYSEEIAVQVRGRDAMRYALRRRQHRAVWL